MRNKDFLVCLILLIFCLLCFSSVNANGFSDPDIMKNMSIQNQLDSIGFNILNSNRIENHITFQYDSQSKQKHKTSKILKSQVIVYAQGINYAQTEDEKAAMLAIGISRALLKNEKFNESSDIFHAPRKYEIFADKRAVDYLVNAGYNPLGMIIFINKSCPQKVSKISRRNTSTQRMAHVYEYIFINYPYFLKNNEYLNNIYYQNFLLNSRDNRVELEKKLKYHYSFEARYE